MYSCIVLDTFFLAKIGAKFLFGLLAEILRLLANPSNEYLLIYGHFYNLAKAVRVT